MREDTRFFLLNLVYLYMWTLVIVRALVDGWLARSSSYSLLWALVSCIERLAYRGLVIVTQSSEHWWLKWVQFPAPAIFLAFWPHKINVFMFNFFFLIWWLLPCRNTKWHYCKHSRIPQSPPQWRWDQQKKCSIRYPQMLLHNNNNIPLRFYLLFFFFFMPLRSTCLTSTISPGHLL